MEQTGRRTKNATFTGATGTGKSTKARQVAMQLNQTINGKVLVVTFGGSGRTWDDVPEIKPTKEGLSFSSGWRKIVWIKYKGNKEIQVLERIYRYLRNCTIIFDDCKMYMRPQIDFTPYLAVICSDHRHLGYDLFFVAHSPKQIPVDVWTYIKYSWIFYSTRKYTEKEIPCENPEAILKAQEKVNKRHKREVQKAGNDNVYGIYEFVEI